MIHRTLQELLKALKGLVVLSQELETMSNSMYINMVPELWAAKVRATMFVKFNYPSGRIIKFDLSIYLSISIYPSIYLSIFVVLHIRLT